MNDENFFQPAATPLGEWEAYVPELEGPPGPGPLPPVPWGGLPGPSLAACAGLARPEVIDRFDFDVDRLKPAHHAILQRIAACLVGAARAGSPITSVRIVGHTDRVGTDSYNDGLGQRRAANTRAALEIAIRRLDPTLPARITFTVETRGEHEPLGDRARSRRVQIFVPPVVSRPRPPEPSTGCPPGYTTRLRVHVKVLAPPRVPIATSIANMQRLYRQAGILVELASTERLSLPTLMDIDTSDPANRRRHCMRGLVSPDQQALFRNRNGVGANDVVVYLVRNLLPGLNGCAAHPPGLPGAILGQSTTPWTFSHEIGHVLGLNHVLETECDADPSFMPTRLMAKCSSRLARLRGLPTLSPSELATMRSSRLLVPCGGRISAS